MVRQWAPGPVRFLRAFHQSHTKKFLDQRRQAKRPNPEQPRRDDRVENSCRDKTEATAKQAQIEVRALKHDLLARELFRKRREIDFRQRIDQIIVTGNADLDQAKLFEIAVQAVRFGVDCDAVHRLQFRKQFRELFVALNHLNPLSSNSAFVVVAFKLSISFSIASIGGSAAMALRKSCTRSHSSGW